MKNKRIEHVRNTLSIRHGIFTENFTILQMQETLEMCRNSNLTNSRRPSFKNDINVTFIT